MTRKKIKSINNMTVEFAWDRDAREKLSDRIYPVLKSQNFLETN